MVLANSDCGDLGVQEDFIGAHDWPSCKFLGAMSNIDY